MSKKASNSERKALHHATYKGNEIIEVLGYSIVYGKTYAEIRFQDGRTKSVPSEDIYVEGEKKNE